MRKAILSSLLILFLAHSYGQQLIANGGFEDINICTEYHVECAPEAWISSNNGINNYYKVPARAHNGSNCMSIEAGNFKYPYRRTFIRSRLICGMRKGSKYELSFYIKSWHEVLDSIGVLFSGKDPIFDRTPLEKINPTFYIDHEIAAQHIDDSLWHRVNVIYTATGEEAFIAFGNYARNDYAGELAHPLENRYLVYFDDVSLKPLDPREKMCAGWEAIRQDIYDENERHALLEKKIKYYSTNPPPPVEVVRTSVITIDTLLLPDILFETGKSVLQTQSFSLLDNFCQKIKPGNIDSLVIEGHTDSVGTLEMNRQLSLDRANAVKEYIAAKTGYNNTITRGWAFLRPVDDNRTVAGRQRNRRVEVFLYIRD